MKAEIERIREDRYRFSWEGTTGPVIEGGWGDKLYPARVTHVTATFTPEGELKRINVTAKKIKKNGETSQVSAYIPGSWFRDVNQHVLAADIKLWRQQAEDGTLNQVVISTDNTD